MNFLDKLMGRQPKNAGIAVAEGLVGKARPRRAEWASQGVVLPPWAKVADRQHERASITIDVDSAAAYAYWLELLDNPPLDQYWLEVAHQCIKLDLQAALANSEHDPRFAERHAAFHFLRAEQYAQAGKPTGRSVTKRGRDGKDVTLSGANLASQGLEAREHYKRVRGSLPL